MLVTPNLKQKNYHPDQPDPDNHPINHDDHHDHDHLAHQEGQAEDAERPCEDVDPEPLGVGEVGEPDHDEGGEDGHDAPLEDHDPQQEGVLLLLLGGRAAGGRAGAVAGRAPGTTSGGQAQEE